MSTATADRFAVTAPLTVSAVRALAKLVEMTVTTAKVARAGEDGTVFEGHARYFCGEGGTSMPLAQDVRDAYLRVTLKSGFEAFWPVSELAPEVESGLFAAYDWSS